MALRSSRTRTTVPSRMSRTIGSAASERALQKSQSLLILRQTRLTMSLLTAPRNRRCQSAPHPARIGAPQVGAGDQRVGSERAALISSQRLAVPLGSPPFGSLQPSARHGDLSLAEAAG